MLGLLPFIFFFFFNDTATTEIYTLSLHDALPIYIAGNDRRGDSRKMIAKIDDSAERAEDRKSTRLNSSHSQISYAVFCLKKKKPTPAPDRIETRRREFTTTHLHSMHSVPIARSGR